MSVQSNQFALHCPPVPSELQSGASTQQQQQQDVSQAHVDALVDRVPEHLLVGKTDRERIDITRGYLAFTRFRQQEAGIIAKCAKEGHASPSFVAASASSSSDGAERTTTTTSAAAPLVSTVQSDAPLRHTFPKSSNGNQKQSAASSMKTKGNGAVLRVQVPKAVRQLLQARNDSVAAASTSAAAATYDSPNHHIAAADDFGESDGNYSRDGIRHDTGINTSTSHHRSGWEASSKQKEPRRTSQTRRIPLAASVHTPSERIGVLNTPTSNIRTAYRDGKHSGPAPSAKAVSTAMAGTQSRGTSSIISRVSQPHFLPIEDFDDDSVDAHTPAEWIALGKRRGGTPAVSKCHVNGSNSDVAWEPCRALSYDPATSTFTIQWDHNGKKKNVKRLNIRFISEDEDSWRIRVLLAEQRRNDAEALFRLMLYVDSMDSRLVAPLAEEQIDRTLALAAREYTMQSLHLVDSFLEMVKRYYTQSMKLSIHLYKYQSPQEQMRLARLGLPPPPTPKNRRDPTSVVRLRGVIKTPSPNFSTARSYILDNLLFTHPLLQTTLRTLHLLWKSYSVDHLFDQDYTKAKLPFPCEVNAFQKVQARRVAQVLERLREEWSTSVTTIIQHHLDKMFNFYEDNMSRYTSSRMQRFVSLVNIIMNTQLRTLVMMSVHTITVFFVQYQIVTDGVLSLMLSGLDDDDNPVETTSSPRSGERGRTSVQETPHGENVVLELEDDKAEREYWEGKAEAELQRRLRESGSSGATSVKVGHAANHARAAAAAAKNDTPQSPLNKNDAASAFGKATGASSELPFPPYKSNRPFDQRILALTFTPTGLQPLFVIRLVAESGSIVFSPTLEYVQEQALSMFDTITKSATNIHGVGHQLFPLLSIPPYVLRPLNEEEPLVSRSRNIVRTVFEQNAEAPRQLAHLYDCFSYVLTTEPDTLANTLKSAPLSDVLVQYDLALERLTRDYQRIACRTPDAVHYELYIVECDGLKRTLLDTTAALRKLLLTQLAARVDEDCHAAIKRFETMYERVAFQPSTPEELQELKDFVDNIPKLLAELDIVQAFVAHGHGVLVTYEYLVTPASFEAYWVLYEWPKKLHQRVEVVQFTCKEYRNYFQQELRERCEKLSHNLTLLANDVEEFTHLWDEARADEYYMLAKNIQTRLQNCQQEATLYNSHQELFGQQQTQWPQLKETKTLFEPHFTLWEIVYTFHAENDRWMNAKLASLNPRDVDNQVNEWVKKLSAASKRITEAEPTEVAKVTQGRLADFKRVIPLLYALRSNLQVNHWRAIYQACGIPREKQGNGAVSVEANESRTLNELIKLSMMDHLPAIEGIATVAQKSFELESELVEMENEWRKLLLEMEPYLDTLKLKANDILQQTLDEHIIKTQSMLGKPIVRQTPQLQVRVSQWEKQLNGIQMTLDEWFRCQGTWSYLEPIFSSADISRSLPEEKQMFVVVDDDWHRIMEGTRSTPQALARCQDTSLLTTLINDNNALEQVLRKLQQFLETKRMAFPRFYFISNEELLQILSDSKDPHLVQPYLAKCFEGIKRVRFEGSNTIVGMESPEGEYVPFARPVSPSTYNNQVELWLLAVESMMKESVREQLRLAYGSYPEEKRTSFVRKWPGQVVIAICSVYWTMEATQAMNDDGTLGLSAYRETCNTQLEDLIVLVRDRTLGVVERCTLEALVVIEVHARDIIAELSMKGVDSPNAFDWLAQLRYNWDGENLDVSQINATLRYGYEYLGNTGRLVITELTDRCYRTLMGALHLNYGGAPEGPAGTGKTETTKDLAKALGKYCIVYNCSDQITSKDMSKLFKGIAQSGSWSCFDEFNRIEVQVLSVIAQQVSSIQDAIAQQRNEFIFDGVQIRLDAGCAVFITMNPGYAGRAELPDNLKALFRPVAMMVPNYAMIGEIQLYSYGFLNGRELAEKIVATYRLCSEQLSSQDHYDYGMRAVKAVLTAAGRLKRQYPDENESVLMLRSIQDVNLPKFLAQDVELFSGIISDLFPSVKLPPPEYDSIHAALETVCEKHNLQLTSYFEKKVYETYEMILVRHGMMIVGFSYGGKSAILKTLSEALGLLEPSGLDNRTRIVTINPKAVTMSQLYGKVEMSGEWTDGILSNRFREASQDTSTDRRWTVLDGPVDAVWIENMNTVLDDNKKLCLQNGDIIPMSKKMNMIFEVQDLAHASPATVSRCGMVYVEPEAFGWQCLIESYVSDVPVSMKENEECMTVFRTLVDALMPAMLEVVRKSISSTVIPQGASIAVASFLKLFHSFARTLDGSGTDDGGALFGGEGQEGQSAAAASAAKAKTAGDNGGEGFNVREAVKKIEGWFIFSLVWSVGGCLWQKDRIVFSEALHELIQSVQNSGAHRFSVQLPERKQSLYDLQFSTQGEEVRFVDWVDTIEDAKFSENSEFQDIVVPTGDTARYTFLAATLIRAAQPFLFVGDTGTGKTIMMKALLSSLPRTSFLITTMQFSAQTLASSAQHIVDSRCERRRRGHYGPPINKRMIVFVDDMNLPQLEEYGAQPPIELLRQLVDEGGWYHHSKEAIEYRNIADVQLVCAMGPTGGGRNPVTQRFLRHFNTVSVPSFTETTLKKVFLSLADWTLTRGFSASLRASGAPLVSATIDLYETLIDKLKPTPEKSHYTFNMRDLSKVFQGISMGNPAKVDDQRKLYLLWLHEVSRAFADRFVDDKDMVWFTTEVDRVMQTHFKMPSSAVRTNDEPVLFTAFMNDQGNYEQVDSLANARRVLEDRLEQYNLTTRSGSLDLVVFQYVIEHVSRICRVLKQSSGNLLLVGVGGSGRRSCAKLAAYLLECEYATIAVSKGYQRSDFHEDIRQLLLRTGLNGNSVVFGLTDMQITEDSFLEDICSLLNSGEVPGIWDAKQDRDTLDNAVASLRDVGKELGRPDTTEALQELFVERCKKHLHIVLCFSPAGSVLRDRLRKFPALVNCTTIDWFREWPEDGLRNVARRFLGKVPELSADYLTSIEDIFVKMHQQVGNLCLTYLEETRQHTYVTPTSYLELLNTFGDLIVKKKAELLAMRMRYDNGLSQLRKTEDEVKVMQTELADLQPELAKKQAQTDVLIREVEKESKVAEEQRAIVAVDEAAANQQAAAAKSIKDESQAKVNEAQPLVEQAQRSVQDLDPKALQEIKALKAPPQGVKYVIEVLCTLLGGSFKPKATRDPLTGKSVVPYWDHAKVTLLTGEFKNTLLNAYPVIVDSAPEDQIEEVKRKMENDMFKMENIRKTSVALVGVATYVKAVVEYYRQNKIIKPLLIQAAGAQQEYDTAMEGLTRKKKELQTITEKLAALTDHLDQVKEDKQALENRVRDTDTKLTRARMLIEGLGGEKARYVLESKRFTKELEYVVGDVVVSSGAVAYLGPFLSQYRDQMLTAWVGMCQERSVIGSPTFSLSRFLGNPVAIQEWKLQGLPADSFSVDNAIIMRSSSRWPLLVDPQQQANNWLRNFEGANGLIVLRPTEEGYIRHLRSAVQDGIPVLLENVEEELDPTLENLLLKRFTKEGSMLAVHIGEPVQWNASFRLYMTTKLPRPHYRPEVCSMVTMINFVITQVGLQDQLLQRVMMSERREIEEKKQALTIEAAHNQASLKQSEDAILAILSSEGNILESESAIEELDRSKLQSDRISKRQEEIEATDRVSSRTRALFAPAAELGAMLFFCVTELSNIDPMYQYSLQFYVTLFQTALADSPKSESVDERIESIRSTFEILLYNNVCRSLFGKDQLLFSFIMALRILKASAAEIRWLLIGGLEKDKGLTANPFSRWLPDMAWRSVWRASTQLGDPFTALPDLMKKYEDFFKQFTETSDPLELDMPQEVTDKYQGLHRLILVRCFRLDKIVPAVREYVSVNLGQAFVEPSLFNLETIVDEMGTDTSVPVIFVLSPGADPNAELDSIAEIRGMSSRLFKLSLGQGQDDPARELIENGKSKGHWVLLQNCHLYKDFMPTLARIIEGYSLPGERESLHRDFRLWLTSLPSEVFPISVLQNGIKLVQEPPQGLRSNLLRSYLSDPIADPKFFDSSAKPDTWRKMLFGLCFFHSLAQERRGFGPLGWNRPYEFNDTDMRISIRQLHMFLDENEEVPYEALRYLTGECNYGGRITDDWDRRCAMALLDVFYTPNILNDGYLFSRDAPEYYAPSFGEYDTYVNYIQDLPLKQSPYIFGLHSNADITKDEREARLLMDATLLTQPRDTAGSGPSAVSGKSNDEDNGGNAGAAAVSDPKAVVMQLAKDVASRMPPLFDVDEVQHKYPIVYEESMNTVLLQETIRYNRLLAVVRRTIADVQHAINGTVVMSAELEQVFNAIFDSKVPDVWKRRSYPSLKPFGSYVNDLLRRIAFLQKWIDEGPPPLFWLSGFFFTQSFLTGVMQNYARRNQIEIDKLVWNFTVMPEESYSSPPKDGCYINGLYLEGAGWSKDDGYLCESNPKELFTTFPVLRLEPSKPENIPDAPRYVCPCYKTTDRRGTLSTTGHSTNFILAIQLPRRPTDSESHWVMRGTALFTQLEY